MKKTYLIALLLVLATTKLFCQACGAGKISFKVFSDNKQVNLNYQLYYVSPEKIDSIIKLKENIERWTKNNNFANGVIIDSRLANLIITSSEKKWSSNHQTINNIVKVVTLELSKDLALFKIIGDESNLYVITNGGGCGTEQNAIIWDENPKTIPIDYRVDLEELELENFPLIVNGSELMINDIVCKWQYLVQPILNNLDNVKILNQKLIAIEENKVLFESNNYAENRNPYYTNPSLNDLEKNSSYNLTCTDVNEDTYCDFQIIAERAGGGANINYITYLFNPKNKQFEYSEVFSDYNTEYDSKKNRISSFMKSGVDDYYYRFKNLKENRKDVEFIETVHHSADTIFYTKLINENIVKEKKIILGEFENFMDYLERK